MSADDHKAIVRRWIEAYNDRDEEAEADARTPDYVAHAPGLPGPLNSDGWTQFIATFSEAFPDIRLTVEDILAEGDMVATRVSFHGTHTGEFQGIPRPTSKWPSQRSRSTASWTARWQSIGLSLTSSDCYSSWVWRQGSRGRRRGRRRRPCTLTA